MKIIFLDIDGVLNGWGFWIDKLCLLARISGIEKFRNYMDNISGGIDERRVKLLAKIVEETDAKIVLCSSWRYGLKRSISKYVSEDYEGIPEDHMKFIKLFEKYNLYVYDYTPKYKNGRRRDIEINNYLSTLNNVTSFVILEDEPILVPLYIYDKKLIKTCRYKDGLFGTMYDTTGLTKKQANKAIEVLNEKTL